ncbi:regulator of chromosome condensation domain-containing protein [Cyclospora cayetanensis]|uniref:Regulator of chromosome condensation domain-containing protein n=1 Tax=Cyclospora cayetanensis TaxID=88456 RepID=A0A1D3D5I8_9EIME|nr:regulator of chromosome condensation domain-containing protein [Cyclospora cayetanensis]
MRLSVFQVYMELEDRRIGGLFCCLMRAVAKQEVMEAPNLMSCMDPGTSNLVELVRMYALRNSSLTQLSNLVLDLQNPNSLASFLSRQMEEEFHYSIEDILAKHGLSRIEEASKDWQEHIRRDFHKGFANLKQFLIAGVVGVVLQQPLPYCLRRILMQTCQFVYERSFTLEPEMLQMGVDYCYAIPIVKLFLNGIMHPILAKSEEFCLRSGLEYLPESVSRKMELAALVLERLCAEDYRELPNAFMLHQLRFDLWNTAAQMLRQQMEIEDQLDVELTIDLFASHYDIKEHYVTWHTDDLLSLVNMCKKYESYLNLSAHDPIAKIVQAVGEGESRSPPFSTALIKECQAAKTSQSFKVDPRFLITEKNLVYCSLTHAPVPQRLALRQRAQTQAIAESVEAWCLAPSRRMTRRKDGQRVLAVLIRYVPPDACDCRMQLADCLRQGPPVSASSLDRLAAEFSAIAEHFASLETPDFVNAALFERVASSLNRGALTMKGISDTDCMRWIAEGLLERKKHKKYLMQVQRHLEGIQSMRREYEIKLRTRVETLKAAIHAADVLAVEEPIEIAARRFNFPLAFPSLRWKQHEKKQETLAVSLTFKYSVLLQRQIVLRAARSLQPEVLVDTYFTFMLLPQEGWRVTITHRTPRVDRQLAQQDFTAEELLVLKNVNPNTTVPLAKTPGEPGGLFEVSALHFVQALQEIRSMASA